MPIWPRIAAAALVLSVVTNAAHAADIALATTGAVDATGLTTMARQPDPARELVKYLALPSSVPVIKANGMDPA